MALGESAIETTTGTPTVETHFSELDGPPAQESQTLGRGDILGVVATVAIIAGGALTLMATRDSGEGVDPALQEKIRKANEAAEQARKARKAANKFDSKNPLGGKN